MITTSNSLSRGSGMPNHLDGALVHAMSGSELSRVRTELDPLRILPTVAPHPVQPHCEPSGHGHFGNVPLPTHRSGCKTERGDGMSKVRVAGFGVSLDGFSAGPEQSLSDPLGKRGTEIFQWFFHTKSFCSMHGRDGGS